MLTTDDASGQSLLRVRIMLAKFLGQDAGDRGHAGVFVCGVLGTDEDAREDFI